jgi:myo-inositol-1(or 4)-monophosphatase
MDLKEFAQSVIQANQEIINYLPNSQSEDYKYSNIIGEGGDNSLKMDLLFEDIFKTYLLNYADIYSEERGHIESQNSNDFQIILDPLDGSDNFLSHIPYFGSSIALKLQDKTIFGAVCNFSSKTIKIRYEDNFYEYDLTSNQLISNPKIDNVKIGIFERSYDYPQIVQSLKDKKMKFRAYGAIALSLSYAHNVNYVLFMGDARDFDVEAGLYLCEDLYIHKDEHFILVARKKKIFEEILAIAKQS